MGVKISCGIMPFGSYLSQFDSNGGNIPSFEGHGWTLEETSIEIDEIVYDKYIHVKRPKLTIYTVNADPHSHMGYVMMVATAYSQESLKEFMSDWNITGKISTRMKVYQTL